MRISSIFGSALTVVVLALSCLTTRCDASCDLALVRGGCQHTASVSGAVSAAHEDHCAGMAAKASEVSAKVHGRQCGQHVCPQPAAVGAASVATEARVRAADPAAGLSAALDRVPVGVAIRFAPPGGRAPGGHLPSARSTSLRI